MRLRTIALSNLRRRKARSAFLMAGILIGVASVVALLSLTDSLTGQARTTMEAYGANIVIAPDTRDLGLSYGGMSIGGLSAGGESLRNADLARIQSIPSRADISIVAPGVVGAIRAGGQRAVLMGVDPQAEFRLKRWWSVQAGRAPVARDEVVAGTGVAKAMGLQMGDYLTIGDRRFTVTGILAETGTQDDQLLIAELAQAQRILGRQGQLTHIQIATEQSADIEEVVRQLGAALPDARITAVEEVVQGRLYAVDQFRSFSYAVVGVVAVIGALVAFITMMGSVNERTGEIGVLRAIGYRRGHVTSLILMEAVTASAAAAVLGYAVGMSITYVLLPAVTQGAQVVWTPAPALAALALAAATGALASLYPAVRAARLEPATALRAL